MGSFISWSYEKYLTAVFSDLKILTGCWSFQGFSVWTRSENSTNIFRPLRCPGPRGFSWFFFSLDFSAYERAAKRQAWVARWRERKTWFFFLASSSLFAKRRKINLSVWDQGSAKPGLEIVTSLSWRHRLEKLSDAIPFSRSCCPRDNAKTAFLEFLPFEKAPFSMNSVVSKRIKL